MSFKIFSLQLTGRIKRVETVEQQRKTLLDDYNEFVKVEASDELKKYLELEKEVNSKEFKKRKAEIEALQFKGSRECNQLNEFVGLQKKRTLKNYFKVVNSLELNRFNKIKESEKLAEYYKLFEYVKEGQFNKDKKEILEQVFKGSVEEKHLDDFRKLGKTAGIKAFFELNNSETLRSHELFTDSDTLKTFVQLRNIPDKDKQKQAGLKRLKRDKEIKAYFKFENSKKLKLYRETANSSVLKQFNDLKTFVESEDFKKREAFLKDKRKFETSEANRKWKRFKQLVTDQDVKFFLKYEKSSLYKNYLDVDQSFDLKRYHELKEITTSKEFLGQKAYLEDKKKWEKSDEYRRQHEYLEMKKLPHLVKYFKYKGTAIFKFFNEWDLVFEDNFSKQQLDSEKWSVKSYVAEKLLGDNYSLAGDNHVFTNGKNLEIKGSLKILVKKEKAEAKVWQMPAGFVPAELEYTSGIISSWNSFWIGDGIFEAKIKFNPVEQVVSSFYLSGEQNMPRVNLLESGTKNRLGIAKLNSKGKADVTGLDISNLKKGWYIFTVVKQGSNFTWKINGTETITQQIPEMNTKLHLNASSIVVSDIPSSKLPAGFEIDWVKCYRKK